MLGKLHSKHNKKDFNPSNGYYYAEPKTNDINNIIDKSGYIVSIRRNELKRRAAELKANKQKAEFIATDYTQANEETQQNITIAKNAIIRELQQATTSEELENVAKAADCLRWCVWNFEHHQKRIIEKAYTSNKRASEALEEIAQKITKIFDIFKGAEK